MNFLKKCSQDVYIALVLLAISVYMIFDALTKMSSDAAQFPILILIVFIALSIGLLIKGIRDTQNAEKEGTKLKGQIKISEIKMPLVVFAFIAVYIVLVDMIGFIVPSLVFTVGLMWFNHIRNKVVCILVPVGLVGFLYGLFTFILASRLP